MEELVRAKEEGEEGLPHFGSSLAVRSRPGFVGITAERSLDKAVLSVFLPSPPIC